jgi:hypothetical protein
VRLAPAIPCCFGYLSDHGETGGVSCLAENPRQVRHNPCRAIDPIVRGRFVQKPQRCYCTFNYAETDEDVLLSHQFPTKCIRVAIVEMKLLAQPIR